MPFDAGSFPRSSGEPAPAAKAPIDWLDLCLRLVVIVPLIAFYTLWVIDVSRTGAQALAAAFAPESR
jgi:hypothetical protein